MEISRYPAMREEYLCPEVGPKHREGELRAVVVKSANCQQDVKSFPARQ